MPATENRITEDMNMTDAVVAMAEGNPGAIRVMAELVNDGPVGLLTIAALDTKHVYGSQIWLIYSDKCGHDLRRFVEYIHHVQPHPLLSDN